MACAPHSFHDRLRASEGARGDELTLTLSLKSVNHRFLDLHLRIPSELDPVEMKVRRVLKERLHRGHIEVTLALERAGGAGFAVNRELVGGYLRTFRGVAEEFGVSAEPDLNAVLKLPGALNATANGDAAEQPGKPGYRGAGTGHRAAEPHARGRRPRRGRRVARAHDASLHRHPRSRPAARQGLKAYHEKVHGRMQELLDTHVDPDRILQEAAMLAERSDIQEELVRMKNHIQHFFSLLEAGGEVGKKLDFLLQEMNREANTLLSKTTGVAGEALRITELGLAMKSEIEKAREQVQNLE